MEYTTDELLALIERHDQFEDYYRDMLVSGIKAEALEEAAGMFASSDTYPRATIQGWLQGRAAALRGER